MDERNIIDLAIENLERNTSLRAKWLKEKAPGQLDGVISVRYGDNAIKLFIEVKKEIRNKQLPQIEKLAEQYANFMLIADHIYPNIKIALRNKNIPYLESNGNIFLKKDNVYFWIEQPNPNKPAAEKLNRAFTKTGLKTVFHFLRYEKDINLPYRKIADSTDTALGNVPNVLNGLKETGFLVKLNKKECKILNKKELLEKWVTAYQEVLKPSLEIGTFKFLKKEDFENWKNLPLKTGKSWWGGEPAGDIYTNYLKPEILTIYTLESRNEIIKNYRLIPDSKGNVRVFKKFWKADEVNDRMVPPLLIYADLINTGDRRCLETAEKIYNELLQDKL